MSSKLSFVWSGKFVDAIWSSLKLHLAYLPNFFSIWTRVLNHNKYVEIKQFSKVDVKQNNISTVILLIKFLVYQWDPRHLQGSQAKCYFTTSWKLHVGLIKNYMFFG